MTPKYSLNFGHGHPFSEMHEEGLIFNRWVMSAFDEEIEKLRQLRRHPRTKLEWIESLNFATEELNNRNIASLEDTLIEISEFGDFNDWIYQSNSEIPNQVLTEAVASLIYGREHHKYQIILLVGALWIKTKKYRPEFIYSKKDEFIVRIMILREETGENSVRKLVNLLNIGL